ncbi:hypothetical protein CDAR_236421 [Caerostris darwini]|uniref:Uncharacterized protein n=1 Tax=Caerostris darwini TaxID=1538125 RepID=A0AAV4T9A0_9ARAC|nr:hypothetical protein CDAR_236421 [Caerostris darwini]
MLVIINICNSQTISATRSNLCTPSLPHHNSPPTALPVKNRCSPDKLKAMNKEPPIPLKSFEESLLSPSTSFVGPVVLNCSIAQRMMRKFKWFQVRSCELGFDCAFLILSILVF